jgi:hypothetical protein
VASKQLVQDLVLTSPATFLSFQQILCPLPTLDIHSNKERHRFDLRDNTDQTRCTVPSDHVAKDYTVKKRLTNFPSPAGISQTKLSVAKNNLIFPGQGEFAWLVASWLGTGKSLTFFFSVGSGSAWNRRYFLVVGNGSISNAP